MPLDDYLKKLDPKSKIAKRLNSYQFKVSQVVLGERTKLCLTPKQVADKLNMSEKSTVAMRMVLMVQARISI